MVVSRFSSSAERQDDREIADGGTGSGRGGHTIPPGFPSTGITIRSFPLLKAQPVATSLVLGARHWSQRHELLFSVPKVRSQLTGAGREGTVRRGRLGLSKLVPISPAARC